VADELDALWGLPLEEFTAERDALAKRMRADGRRDEAAEVAALRKPSVAAWVVNRLARARRDDVHELVAAAEAIRGGRRDGDERFRETADRLTRSAREILSDAGRPASDVVLREVTTTLRAGAAEAPEELVAGRLSHALEPSGFGAMAGAAPRERPARSAPAPKRPRPDRQRVEHARRALAEAKDEATRLRRTADETERTAKRARREADQAAKRVAEAEQRLADARNG
jgi:hypothetical protein